MILTGSEIEREWARGRITIEPFTPEQLNPNSYNFRLGRTLRLYSRMPLDPRKENAYEEVEIPDTGYVLEPGRLYLAHTEETLGSDHYAPTFAARSSVARVPRAFVVPVAEFAAALTGDQDDALSRAFAETRATVGAFFTETSRHVLDAVRELRVPDELRRLLAVRMREVFGDPGGLEFAVRSSGTGEDTAAASLAGVHSSVLGVRAADVAEAVAECWRSYYEPPAVA